MVYVALEVLIARMDVETAPAAMAVAFDDVALAAHAAYSAEYVWFCAKVAIELAATTLLSAKLAASVRTVTRMHSHPKPTAN